MIPIAQQESAIFLIRSIFSVGIHTFIFAQRLAPVNIEMKIKKNHINQKIPKVRYATSASAAIISIRVVNLMPKATPTMNPASAMSR